MMQPNQDNATTRGFDKNTSTSTGLYVWSTDALLNATKAVYGEWHHLDQNITDQNVGLTPTRIITDTRQLQAGDIFLAIVGDNFDGHTFLAAAQDKGAIAAIVSRVNDDIDLPQLRVEDTRLAFGQIAAYRRAQNPDLKVIALTGSSGKTTVKEMLGEIFKQLDKTLETGLSSTLITRGNLNNDYGVPMMLLELEQQHRYAILELGANHVGEIAYTAELVKPDVACILNIGTAHLGEFSGRDNIAKTKAEIYQSLTAAGTAVVPNDDDYTELLKQTAKQYTSHIMTFGWHNDATDAAAGNTTNDATSTKSTASPSTPSTTMMPPTITATDIVSTASDSQFILQINPADGAAPIRFSVHLPLPGAHNISNALAAAGCAYALGIAPNVIADGLNTAQSSKGRLDKQQMGRHQIIDDTYNANPNSVRAAADVLAAQDGFKILVLGDIGELGEAAKTEHSQLGDAIADKKIDLLLCVGEFAHDTVSGAINAGMPQAIAFANKDELLIKLLCVLEEKEAQNIACTLLFKGSRSATMETLIEALV